LIPTEEYYWDMFDLEYWDGTIPLEESQLGEVTQDEDD
jgi:hypothetical protein